MRLYTRLLALSLFCLLAIGVQSSKAACTSNFQTSNSQCPTVLFYSGATSTSGTIIQWSWTFGDGGTSSLQNPSHTYTSNGTYNACLTITTSQGCTANYCSNVSISCIQPNCTAFFTTSNANCPAFAFTSTSTTTSGTITGWNWTFGDGSTGTGSTATHTYAANGTYTVCLTITTSTGCTNTYCSTVNVTCVPPPTCAASFNIIQAVCPSYYFSSTSTTSSGTITGYSWNFGDGSTGTGANAQHTYTANGTYQICLTITASTGCTNTICQTVTVSCIPVPCQAGFTVNMSGCPQILFTNTSSNLSSGVAFLWSFGDGTSSTATNPAHTYLTNGSYNVCLTMTTPDNCTNTYCSTVNITCNQPPVCAANFAIQGVCPQFYFVSTSTTSSGTITSYSWNFGDGTTGTGANTVHTYTANGVYTVCLTITASTGCTNTYCVPLNVTCIQPPTCTASFTTAGVNCPNFAFASTSTTGSGTITGWSWSFGDGSAGTGANVTHTYTASGSYTVCLTITTSSGCTNTACSTITVTCIPTPTCTANFNIIQPNCPLFYFLNTSTSTSGTIISYSWNFGDGTTGTGPQVFHNYTANGTYQVCLTITTTTGCTSTFCRTVNVTCIQPPTCNANFNIYNANLCGLKYFSSTSTTSSGTITSYSWNFGDGTTGSGQTTSHTYTANGTYQACLTITTSTGCTSTFCRTVVITCVPPPTCNANFNIINATPCGLKYFSSTSTSTAGPIVSYSWNFGDGTTGTGAQTSHAYTSNGIYQVCLTITTSTGCTSTRCRTVVINCLQTPTCIANFNLYPANCPLFYFYTTSTTTSGTITGYSWTFGDGTTGTGPQTSHTYTSNGTYIVCLTITTSTGCTNTRCRTVTVTCIPQACTAAFTSQSTSTNHTTYFVNQSTSTSGTIIGWNWTFGDGSTSTLPNPVHSYANSGAYNVCLTITTSTGCTNTVCHTVNVPSLGNKTSEAPAELPILSMQAMPNPFGDQLRVQFTLGDAADVSLTLYDSQGKTVATLAQGPQDEGAHEVSMDGTALSKGIYILRIQSGDQTQSLRVVRQ